MSLKITLAANVQYNRNTVSYFLIVDTKDLTKSNQRKGGQFVLAPSSRLHGSRRLQGDSSISGIRKHGADSEATQLITPPPKGPPTSNLLPLAKFRLLKVLCPLHSATCWALSIQTQGPMEDISHPKHNRYQTPEKETSESIRPGVEESGSSGYLCRARES